VLAPVSSQDLLLEVLRIRINHVFLTLVVPLLIFVVFDAADARIQAVKDVILIQTRLVLVPRHGL